jgi:hypothetical protein
MYFRLQLKIEYIHFGYKSVIFWKILAYKSKMIKIFPIIFIILWSSAFVTTKPIIDNSDPFAALAFRFFFVALGFFVFALYAKKKIFTNNKNLFQSIFPITQPEKSLAKKNRQRLSASPVNLIHTSSVMRCTVASNWMRISASRKSPIFMKRVYH